MFVTFEGVEGAGKGTMLARCNQWLSKNGLKCVLTREPGGTPLGNMLRSLLLDVTSPVTPSAEMFLYLADRAQHVEKLILPALREQRVVLCDRYADSNIVYQGIARGLGAERLFRLNDEAVNGVWPDLTLVFDLDVRIGLRRAKERNRALGVMEKEGRFENEALVFHEKVRQGFLEWASRNSQRMVIIDASKDQDAVFAQVQSALENQPRMQFLLLKAALDEIRSNRTGQGE